MKIGESRNSSSGWQHVLILALYSALNRFPAWVTYRVIAPLTATVSMFIPSLLVPVIYNMRQLMGAKRFLSPALWVKNVWGVLLHSAYTWADHMLIPKMDLETFGEGVRLDGFGHLEDAIDSGRGVMIVSGHFSGLFLILHKLLSLGISPLCPTEPLTNKVLNSLAQRLRCSKDAECKPLGGDTMKAVFRRLRDGGVVVLLVDRDIQGGGESLQFLGQTTRLPLGAAKIAMRTGCLVVPTTWERLDLTRFTAVFHQALDPKHFEDAASLTKAVLPPIETQIRKNLPQWVVIERMWRKGES